MPNYIKTFGVLPGLRLLLNIEFYKKGGKNSKTRQVNVHGYDAPVHLRDNVADYATFWQCLVLQQYDFSTFVQAEQIFSEYQKAIDIGQDPLIIDCGGNIGLATLWLAKRFPNAKIYVLEPDEDNFKVLKANVATLGNRVVCLKGGIWNKTGRLRIINPDAGSAAFRVEELPLEAEEGIRAYTIDEICGLAEVNSPLYVKLDIEGAQSTLFSSNTEWVSRASLISLELDDWLLPWKNTSQNFFRALSQHPFDYLIRDESIFCFRNPSWISKDDRFSP